MEQPLVSIIIPTYAGADHLGDAIRSVLSQSYTNLELIVVNDVSPDGTDEVVRRFNDPRLRYIIHQTNQGAVAARKTGVDASHGEIIAFLDQDDTFHQDKLQVHVNFLREQPEVGVTYNDRFELEPSSTAVRALWQPPETVGLADLVLGFPFSPSDTVLRRELALREEIWDQSYVSAGSEMIFNGAEIIMGGRLALEGCKFANVGHPLNYRRFHAQRVFRDIYKRCAAELKCQGLILDDPRCPPHLQPLRREAYTNTYLIWAYYAFAQDESELGQDYLRQAVRLTPALLNGQPCSLVLFLASHSATDGGDEFETHAQRVFAQLPPELSGLSTQLDRVIAQQYLDKGAHAIVWNRPIAGERFLSKAIAKGAVIDESFVQSLSHELLGFQKEFGPEATERVLAALTTSLRKVSKRRSGRRLVGCYAVNQAFQYYRTGNYSSVRPKVLQAISNNPSYLLNRGVLAILLRSTAAGLLPNTG